MTCYFYCYLIILALFAAVVLYNDSQYKIEKFRPYYNGTRLCNNRGCDVRYVRDMGTYYCPNKEYLARNTPEGMFKL
jgi:hypothetical protein